jgi:arylamine N-acetyltransferase
MLREDSTFTRAELLAYFRHIRLPETHQDCLDADEAPSYSLLLALHVHQIAAIPYENLSLHYSPTKTISLDPHDLYAKFITADRNRGGYCMENAIFFLHVLRALGFDVYPTGVRIRLRTDGVPSGDYVGLVHTILVVTFPNGERWSSDVAFGGDGPTVPLPLLDPEAAPTHITTNLGSQQVRIIRDFVPGMPARASLGGKSEAFWVYQYRNSSTKDWNSFYCFQEIEFLEQDFTVMNFYTSQGKTFQRVMILIIKFLLSDAAAEGDGSSIIGKVMMFNGMIKRNMGGKTEIVEDCKTEPQRIEALKRWFGIELTEEEIRGIAGEITELKDVQVIGA